MIKTLGKIIWILTVNGVVIMGGVIGLGYLTWALSANGSATSSPPAISDHDVGHHRVSEWQPDRQGQAFREAPMLASRVEAGELPPVSQRLPVDPLVVIPPQQVGPYGGTWKRLASSVNDIGSVMDSRLGCEMLMRLGPMGEEILPNLVKRWTVSDDGRAFTFHLRQGVCWSDGEPFTADDILFWYEAVLQEPQLTPIIPAIYRHGGELMRLEKIDDYAIRITFAAPLGLLPFKVASHTAFGETLDYPAHYFKRFHKAYMDEAELDRRVDAAGFERWYQLFNNKTLLLNPDRPTLLAWVLKFPPPAQTVVYERNPYYWKVDAEGNQLPYIDRVTFQIYGQETINLKAIAGEVGMQNRHMNFSNLPLFTQRQQRGEYTVRLWPYGTGMTNIIFLNLNHRDPLMRELIGDRRFRIALSLAIDREAINEAFYFGMGQPRQVSPTSTSPYYDPIFETRYAEHDPSGAVALLEAVGLERESDGSWLLRDGRPLTLTLETATNLANSEIMELVVAGWREIGIKADLRVHSRTLWWMRRRAALPDAVAWSGGNEQWPLDASHNGYFPASATAHHAPYYGQWFQSRGESGHEPPAPIKEAMQLYRDAEKTRDASERDALIRRMIELNREHLWLIGTVGDVPGIVLVPDTFRNVPSRAMYSWTTRSPGNTAPECYAIDPGPDMEREQ